MKLELPFPKGLELVQTDGAASVEFVVPMDYPYFEGHFPGNPIVPAVTQIGWATAGIGAMIGAPIGDYRLSRFKFIRPIRPLDEIRLSLVESAGKYAYRIFSNEELCCSGSIILISDD